MLITKEEMMKETICKSIASKKIISFHYSHGSDPGIRYVEPHMVAFNRKKGLSLSAWFLRGNSASEEKPGWREYHLDGITQVAMLVDTFTDPREGYVPDGGKVFHNVQCAL